MFKYLNYKKLKTFLIPKSTTGFTLVESLVAISILMVAIVTPMTIAQKGLGSATYSKDQMTASFLAQDAIEYIKNKRDEIGLINTTTSSSTTGVWIGNGTPLYTYCVSGDGSNKCSIDTTSPIPGTIYAEESKILKVSRDVAGNFLTYGYGVGVDSKFTRKISIIWSDTSNPSEALIDVVVSWQGVGVLESVEIKNYIYDYWENL